MLRIAVPPTPKGASLGRNAFSFFMPDLNVGISGQVLPSEEAAAPKISELKHPSVICPSADPQQLKIFRCFEHCFDKDGKSLLTQQQVRIIALQLLEILKLLETNKISFGSIDRNWIGITHNGHIAISQWQHAEVNSPQYEKLHNADIWSVGMILMRLVKGKLFHKSKKQDALDQLGNSGFEGELKELLEALLVDKESPQTSFSPDQLKKLAFFKDLNQAQPFSGNNLFLEPELHLVPDSIQEAEQKEKRLSAEMKRTDLIETDTSIPAQSDVTQKSFKYFQRQAREQALTICRVKLAVKLRRAAIAQQHQHAEAFAKSIDEESWRNFSASMLKRLRLHSNVFTLEEWQALNKHRDTSKDITLENQLTRYHKAATTHEKIQILGGLSTTLESHPDQNDLLSELHRRVKLEKMNIEAANVTSIKQLDLDETMVEPGDITDFLLTTELEIRTDIPHPLSVENLPKVRKIPQLPTLKRLTKDTWKQASDAGFTVFRRSIKSIDEAVETYASAKASQEEHSTQAEQALFLACIKWLKDPTSQKSSRGHFVLGLMEELLRHIDQPVKYESIALTL